MSYTGVLGAIPSSSTPLKTTIIQDPLSASSNIQLDANGNTYLVPVTGNVGIGTSSPAYKLDVAGAISTNNNLTFTGTGNRITGDFSNATHANRVAFQTSTVNAATSPFFIPNGTGTTASIVVANASDPTNSSFGQMVITGTTDVRFVSGVLGTGTYLPMTFYTGGSERMRLDTSGNVGIGTNSPSTYGIFATYGSVSNSGSALGAADATTSTVANVNLAALGNRATQSFNFSFGKSVVAGYYAAFNGSGDIGTGLLFGTQLTTGGGTVERMRIDQNGNVGIGATSTYGYKMFVLGSTNVGLAVSDNTNTIAMYGNGGTAVALGTPNSVPLFFTTGATERMRIDTSGNVGIGTSSPAGKLAITAAATAVNAFVITDNSNYTLQAGYGGSGVGFIGGTASTALALWANNAEKARIDSSGNLLVGATAALSSSKVLISCSMNSFNGLVMQDTGSVGGNYVQFLNSAPTQAGAITHNGTTTVLYTTSSDYRLKEEIQPMSNALGRISQLKPVTFNWKQDGSSGEGFIAHELQSVIPGAVSGTKDEVDAEGNPKYQGIDASFVVATLVAAVQELKAEFDAYKASHA